MLAAVKGQHLAGHRRGIEDEADGLGDFAGRGAALQQGGLNLPVKIFFSLMNALEDRPGPDRVDAHARRERLREHACGAPQPRFRDRIGEELRRQVPDPLVDHVDDMTFAALGQARDDALVRNSASTVVPCLSIAVALEETSGPSSPAVDVAVWSDADDDLSFATWESQRLRQMIPRSREAPAPVGDDAARSLRDSGLLDTSRVLHFASHGRFDPEDPRQSYLRLGAGAEGDVVRP